jgi:hypothetical protein
MLTVAGHQPRVIRRKQQLLLPIKQWRANNYLNQSG